jgi:hypothetical protein
VSTYFLHDWTSANSNLNAKNSRYENGKSSFVICLPVSFVPNSRLNNEAPEYIKEFYGTPLDEKEPRSQNPSPQLALDANDDKNNLLDFFP